MERQDFRCVHRLRVRWAEVDMQKIVFNAHYLMYFDTAIADYWRALALPYQEAMDRLVRQRGRVARVQWRSYSMALLVTPAGLFNLAPEGAAPDLQLHVTEASPLALASVALRGDKPAIRIEGDVQLAAEINWLVDHVRWDLEEDVARLIGDAPAHTLGQVVRKAAQALRQFVGTRMASAAVAPAPGAAPAAPAAPPGNADRTAP